MMKNILLLVILLLFGFNSSAQIYENIRLDRKELPAYLIANENDNPPTYQDAINQRT